MSGNPFAKWFFNDWETDPGLKVSSLAAQGLWKRMLCVAAKSEPVGFVAIAGRGLTVEEITRLCGCGTPVDVVKTLIDELEANNVFSRDRNKVIYSRRIVRDARKSKTNQENGKMGGNPTLRKTKGKSKSVKPHNQTQIQDQSPEQLDLRITGTSAPSKAWPRDYRERFWERYPRRKAKVAAMKALDRVKESGAVDFETMMAAVDRYAEWAKGKDPKYVKHPATWLNGGCWDDEDDSPGGGDRPRGGPTGFYSRFTRRPP